MQKDDKKTPNVAINPPKKAVLRIPNLSASIPDTGESANVAPICIDPTRDAFVAASGSFCLWYISTKASKICPDELTMPKTMPLHMKLQNNTVHA